MYKSKYVVETDKRREGIAKQTTNLQVEFDFSQETPQFNRRTVTRRINLDDNYLLLNYLAKHEGLHFDWGSTHHKVFYDIKETGRWVSVTRPMFSPLKLKIKVIAKGNVPLEKMLDLDPINDLILTGKFPEEQKNS